MKTKLNNRSTIHKIPNCIDEFTLDFNSYIVFEIVSQNRKPVQFDI